MAKLTASDLIELFSSNNVAAKVAFLDACPPSPALAIAKKYIAEPHLEINLAGLSSLAETYARGIDCQLGVVLSETVYRLSQEALLNHFQDDYLQNAFLFCAGSSLTSWLVGLNNSGHFPSTVQIGESGYAWLSQKTYPESKAHLAIVRLSMVDACLQMAHEGVPAPAQTLEQAGTWLDKTDWSGLSPVYQQTLAQLRRTYHQLVQSATQLPEDDHPSDTNSKLFQELDQNLGVLNSGIEALQSTFPGIADRFKSIAQQLGDARQQGNAQSFNEWVLQNQPLADALADFLSTAKPEEKQKLQKLQLQKQIRKASLIFTDPAHRHNPKTIQNSLSILQDARQQTRHLHFIEDENDALWGLYLCYSRLQQMDEAIETLQALRQNLECLRSGIADPLKRAGVFQKYPYLFAALCQLLCRAKRPAELLNAMEGAKGRALADVLTRKQGNIVEDSTFSEPVKYLPQLMHQAHGHYLSYFVDDDSTYAVLVTKQGELHSAEIPLGKTSLREWTSGIDPKTWGRPIKGFAGPRIPHDLPDQLSPLVSWLAPLVQTGKLKQQDHICYCPDEELHLVPLHYITLMGQPLVKWFSVSRTQGAYSLVSLLQQPVDYLSQALVLQVPLKHEQENRQDIKFSDKLTQLSRGPNWLAQHLPTRLLVEEEADLETIQTIDLRYRVVHFSTHCTFPDEDKHFEGRDKNPFTASGLLLASGGHLPDGDQLREVNSAHLLTPKKVLDLNFSGTHISMMACVTGKSKEGIGGDALGLEWAFLQAGASSLLSTHWDTDVTAAAEFSLRFYDKWLIQHLPRSAAWRETALELMETDWSSRYPAEYFWAAFSLSGDWR